MISNLLHNCLYTLDTKSKSINGQYTYIDRKIYHIFVLVIDTDRKASLRQKWSQITKNVNQHKWNKMWIDTNEAKCESTQMKQNVNQQMKQNVNQHKGNKMWINTNVAKWINTNETKCESTQAKQEITDRETI
jgi:N-acetylneuraminic acid mutarotase